MKAARRAAPVGPEDGSDSPAVVPAPDLDEDEEDFDDTDNPFLKSKAAKASEATSTKPAAVAPSASADGDSGDDAGQGESRGHMLQRHKKVRDSDPADRSCLLVHMCVQGGIKRDTTYDHHSTAMCRCQLSRPEHWHSLD